MLSCIFYFLSPARVIINEMNAIFTKNQTVKKENIVEDFIEDKRKDFKIEQARENANE